MDWATRTSRPGSSCHRARCKATSRTYTPSLESPRAYNWSARPPGTSSGSTLPVGVVEQFGRAEHALDAHLDDDPARVDARGAVALGVAQLGVADRVRIVADGGLTLQGNPACAVDLTQH